MSGSYPKNDPDGLALLARMLLSEPSARQLHQLDIENLELGTFLKRYAGPAEVAEIGVRSSLREDAAIRDLSQLLTEFPGDLIRVLDVCCGIGTLAKRISRSVINETGRIAYWAIDRDTGCIETIKAQPGEFDGFHSFTLMQREAWDLVGLQPDSMDLIVVSNVLHEIPPHLYSRLFSIFNSHLKPSRGRICIIDMEQLPTDEPECIAINWHGSEVEQFLRAGGLRPEVTVHEKDVQVYQVHVNRAAVVDETAINREIKKLLRVKLTTVIARRKLITAAVQSGANNYREWLVLTGTIARYAEELACL
jgi:ubiquinone/menaquinone biosynthesis C-methylase UbiE